jgi:hypothetical protein
MVFSGCFFLPTPLRDFARMANDTPAVSLLEELDARQNELLEELDQLNGQIERVIAEWTTARTTVDPSKQAA